MSNITSKKFACLVLAGRNHGLATLNFLNKSNKYNIIAYPGCYPTSIQIPLVPLMGKKLINEDNIIIDAKSGYSGGGRRIKSKFSTKVLLSVQASAGVPPQEVLIIPIGISSTLLR